VTTAGDDRSKDGILVFSAGTTGNSSPARIISGPATRVRFPQGVAVSATGFIYVSTQQDSGSNMMGGVQILIFAPAANGNVAPVSGIDGDCDPKVWTAGPVAVGSDGRIYVAITEFDHQKIVVFKDQLSENPNFASITPPSSPPCGNAVASVSGWDSDPLTPTVLR